eukprot:3702768-Rhodomonas_salina.2
MEFMSKKLPAGAADLLVFLSLRSTARRSSDAGTTQHDAVPPHMRCKHRAAPPPPDHAADTTHNPNASRLL